LTLRVTLHAQTVEAVAEKGTRGPAAYAGSDRIPLHGRLRRSQSARVPEGFMLRALLTLGRMSRGSGGLVLGIRWWDQRTRPCPSSRR
jgi:hypothetical protein